MAPNFQIIFKISNWFLLKYKPYNQREVPDSAQWGKENYLDKTTSLYG